MKPFYTRIVSLFGNDSSAHGQCRMDRIVRQFTTRQHRYPLIEQVRQHPQNARFGLAAQAQQKHIVSTQQGMNNLGQDGIFITDQPFKKSLAIAQSRYHIAAQFILDAAWPVTGGF